MAKLWTIKTLKPIAEIHNPLAESRQRDTVILKALNESGLVSNTGGPFTVNTLTYLRRNFKRQFTQKRAKKPYHPPVKFVTNAKELNAVSLTNDRLNLIQLILSSQTMSPETRYNMIQQAVR